MTKTRDSRKAAFATAILEAVDERTVIIEKATPDINIFLAKCRAGLDKSSPQEIAGIREAWIKFFDREGPALETICKMRAKGLVITEDEIPEVRQALEKLVVVIARYYKKIGEVDALQNQRLSLLQEQAQRTLDETLDYMQAWLELGSRAEVLHWIEQWKVQREMGVAS